jgi:hypothetical protein
MTTRIMTKYAVVMGLAAGLALSADRTQADTTGFSFTFTSPPNIPYMPKMPLRTGGLVLGDFSGDGKVEAVIPGTYIAGVAVVLNSSTATWVTAGAWPVAATAADFNGDGHADLAVCERDAGGVAIYTNDGIGGFTRTAFYPTGDVTKAIGPQAVLTVDLDRNGKPDLLVANRYAGTVVVLYNTGSGFVGGPAIPVSGEPSALVAADLYGHGRTDAAVACAADDTVKILKNVRGQLQLAGTFDAGPYPVAIAAADLNADEFVDLAVADREAPQVTVLLNDGTGQFTPRDVALVPPGYGAFEPPVDVQLVDTDADGTIDIRCAGVTLVNDGAANFTISGSSASPDAVYAKALLPSEPYPFLGVVYRPSTNLVTVSYQAPPPLNPVVGDINGDGRTDMSDLLMLADSWSTRVGETGFIPACDLDRDGGVDVVDLLILAANWAR